MVFLYIRVGCNSGVARNIVLSSAVFLLIVWFVFYLLERTLDIELVIVYVANNLILGSSQQRVMIVTSFWVYILKGVSGRFDLPLVSGMMVVILY